MNSLVCISLFLIATFSSDPSRVKRNRESIEALGGEYRFQSKVTDLDIRDGQMHGVVLESGEQIATNHVVLALFALNRTYPINDKTALEEIAEFERAPRGFGPRLDDLFARLGASVVELGSAVERVGQLLRETIELTDGLYRPRYALPACPTEFHR